MRKRLSISVLGLLAAALMAFGLAACGGDSDLVGRYDLTSIEAFEIVFQGDEIDTLLGEGPHYIEILPDSTLELCINGEVGSGEYTRDGNVLAVTRISDEIAAEATITVADDTLVLRYLDSSGLEMIMTFTKAAEEPIED